MYNCESTTVCVVCQQTESSKIKQKANTRRLSAVRNAHACCCISKTASSLSQLRGNEADNISPVISAVHLPACNPLPEVGCGPGFSAEVKSIGSHRLLGTLEMRRDALEKFGLSERAARQQLLQWYMTCLSEWKVSLPVCTLCLSGDLCLSLDS